MQIKKILKYDWNYGEYIVSDGCNEIICMCISVPLPNGKDPKVGMAISMLYGFTFGDIKIEKLTKLEDKVFYLERGGAYFKYCLQGKIIDARKSLVQVYGFNISLEYQFCDGFPANYSNGDFIKIEVDRIDCCIDLK